MGHARRCTVSYRDAEGIRHSVTVQAAGLREACCLALAELRARRIDGDWGEPPGPATELSVEVHPPTTTHVTKVADVMRWLEGGAANPATAVDKARLRKLLKGA
jgi:hypothetical protein